MSRPGLIALAASAILFGGFVVPTQASASAPGCRQGYYENVLGNCVQRPTSATSRPAGATAKCRDGTYSFSQSHSGTCSHHGGVATWYRRAVLAKAT